MIIYTISYSRNGALHDIKEGRYYDTLEDAQKDLKQFGKRREKIFELEIPIREVVYATKTIGDSVSR